MRAAHLTLALALPSAAAPLHAQQGAAEREALPDSRLEVMAGGEWRAWWSAARAPAAWPAPSRALLAAARWTPARAGLETATLRVRGAGGLRLRVSLVRLDPRRHSLALALATRDAGLRGAWTVDSFPSDGALAVNAGQFVGGMPWGWLVRAGREEQPPGAGPLSTAVVVDQAGLVRLAGPDEIAGLRAAGVAREAFQSYPTLLAGAAEVPAPLRAPGGGVDVAHRDSRVALGVLRDGRVLLVITRLDAPGPLAALPLGLTVPELAALMGALGCTRAVALDGGLSGQLAVRDTSGTIHRWPGMRMVPLALVARDRTRVAAGGR